jgi:hypothetical protein
VVACELDCENIFQDESLYCNSNQCYDLSKKRYDLENIDGVYIKNIQADKEQLKESWMGANDGGDLVMLLNQKNIKIIAHYSIDEVEENNIQIIEEKLSDFKPSQNSEEFHSIKTTRY